MTSGDYESDADSTVTLSEKILFLHQEIVPLEHEDIKYSQISSTFNMATASYPEAQILQVYKNVNRSRAAVFRITCYAVAKACGGNANVAYAWFGGSARQIQRVLTHGFCGQSFPVGGRKNGHGIGVYLSHVNHAGEYVKSCAPDEEGRSYMLLCRVILGRTERIPMGSPAFFPSSGEFHTGVDDVASPRRYVVWYCNMNTHVFPEFVVCFRRREAGRMPCSPFVKLDLLMSLLRESLDEERMEMAMSIRSEFEEMKITRREMVERLRMVVDDRLLASIIMQCN